MIKCTYQKCKNEIPLSTVQKIKKKRCGCHAHIMKTKNENVEDEKDDTTLFSSDDDTWGSSIASDDLSYTSSEPDCFDVVQFHKKLKQIRNDVRFTN
jgi:hypothetical protein